MMRLLLLAVLAALFPTDKQFVITRLSGVAVVGACSGNCFYLSPTGSDSNSCTASKTRTTPKKTFSSGVGCMSAGDTLVLEDGTYSTAAGTGGYHWDVGTYPNSAQLPNGTSTSAMTTLMAEHDGAAFISVPLYLGRSSGRQQYIKLHGMSWKITNGESACFIRNASYIYVKNVGCYTDANADVIGYGLGDISDTWPSTDHILTEDVWVDSKTRGITVNFGGRYNVWRRVFIRGDGCSKDPDCTINGNPNIGISVYASGNTSLQNVFVVDRILNGGSPYADFAQAQHGNFSGGLHGQNEWLGDMSLHSEDDGYTMDPDTTELTPGSTFRDNVIWDVKNWCMDVYNSGNADAQNITCAPRNAPVAGLYFGSGMSTGTNKNNVVTHTTGSGGLGVVDVAETPSYIDLAGTWDTNYPNNACATGCKTGNPISDGTPASLKYVLRIESGSALYGTGSGGANYGATIVKRYGCDGCFYGDAGYNTLSGTDLWPYPNQARIKTELCSTFVSETRGFCSAASISYYVWNYLGNGCPGTYCT
jgi:hypothetical protein